MPSTESASRQWRARLRTSPGRGRGGWIAWLIAALLCVQMWGLQHEIVHARELAGIRQQTAATSPSHSFAVGTGDASGANDTVDSADADADSDAAIEANWSVQSARTTHTGFGNHHHHCHLFEGATLAAAMAVAVLQWAGDANVASTPARVTGRSHASAVSLPFDSRAPPVAV